MESEALLDLPEDGDHLNLEHAERLAKEVVELLRPACERIEIAGGIRRGKAEPHDLEIVARPRFVDHTGELLVEQSLDFFGEKKVDVPVPLKPTNELHPLMYRLVRERVIELGDETRSIRLGKPIVTRAPFNEKYYRVKYKSEKLDIFAVTPPAQWGVVFTLRTGDAGYSHWLVSQGWPRGIFFEKGHLEERWKPHSDEHMTRPDHIEGMLVQGIPTPEEKDVFEKVGVPWLNPANRVFENGIVI